MNKKGQLGMDIVRKFLGVFLVIAIIGFALIVALANLNTNTGLTGLSSTNANSVLNNVSGGVATLFGNAGTWMVMLGVAVLILIIGVVIFAVNRFGKG